MTIRELLQSLTVGDPEDNMLLSAKETGLPLDMLVTTLKSFGSVSNTGQGEFFFYGDERPEIFACRITVVAAVLAKNVGPLCVELAAANHGLPFGSFSYSADENSIIYSLNVPVSEGLSNEEIIKEADLCIRLALKLASGYAGAYEFFANSTAQ